jgi:hypothetical protein
VIFKIAGELPSLDPKGPELGSEGQRRTAAISLSPIIETYDAGRGYIRSYWPARGRIAASASSQAGARREVVYTAAWPNWHLSTKPLRASTALGVSGSAERNYRASVRAQFARIGGSVMGRNELLLR